MVLRYNLFRWGRQRQTQNFVISRKSEVQFEYGRLKLILLKKNIIHYEKNV